MKKTLMRKLESIPVLASEGAILPLSGDCGNYAGNPSELDVQIYNGNGRFTLYEDGTENKKTGEAFTNFVSEYKEEDKIGIQTVKIECSGVFSVLPEDRRLKLIFKNIPEGKVRLFENGVEIPAEDVIADYAVAKFSFNPGTVYTVQVEFAVKTRIERLIDRAVKVLMSSEGSNTDKLHNCWVWLKNATSVEEYLEILMNSKVSPAVKNRLSETV